LGFAITKREDISIEAVGEKFDSDITTSEFSTYFENVAFSPSHNEIEIFPRQGKPLLFKPYSPNSLITGHEKIKEN